MSSLLRSRPAAWCSTAGTSSRRMCWPTGSCNIAVIAWQSVGSVNVPHMLDMAPHRDRGKGFPGTLAGLLKRLMNHGVRN
jgi:hypothetical protein